MKKMFVAAALVIAALAMTSCNGEGCWKINTKTTILGVSAEATVYVYGNGEDADAAIDELKAAAQLLQGEFKATKTKVNMNQDDCLATNAK